MNPVTSENGGDEEEMGPGIETLVAEKAEQVQDARADAEQTDDDVDEHKWRHAQDCGCDPRGGKV
jgi:hypothetical protein